MHKPLPPLKALADREGFELDYIRKITGYGLANVYKALREQNPKGWLALALEIDRLHRISKHVLEAENQLLCAKLEELEAKHRV